VVATCEAEFALVIERNAEALRRELGHDPTDWAQLIHRHGALGAVRHWLRANNDASTELMYLAAADRLDQSNECYVLVYQSLFDHEGRHVAYRRLRCHGGPVDRWLRDRLSGGRP
jgi:hypothetical protein